VRIVAATCPFCAASLPAARAQYHAPRALTRAAIFSAALAGGCEKGAPPPKPAPSVPKDAAIDAATDAVAETELPGRPVIDPYGAPPARRRIV